MVFVRFTGTKDYGGRKLNIYKCFCGEEVTLYGYQAKQRKECSCKREIHGESGEGASPEYIAWLSMKNRCKPHLRYGRKGIRVGKEWGDSFYQFFKERRRLHCVP